MTLQRALADVDPLGERFRPWRTLAAVCLLTAARQ
jgi:hypothetical protein